MRKRLLFPVLIALLAMGISPLSALHARESQDNAVTITVAVPTFETNFFTDTLLQDFEKSHPNIRVKVVAKDAMIPPPSGGLDAYFKAIQDYVSAADVLYVNSNFMTPEATRAGYLLDLAPLSSVDKTLNTDDFYPAVWKSFQWDQGVWALPTGADVSVLAYKPAAFDAAGLAYPNDKWTLDDFANAARKLAQKDASGNVSVPSVFVGGREGRDALAQSLIGTSLFDPGTPDALHFDTPQAEKALDTWYQLDKDGLFANDMSSAPIAILPAMFTSAPTQNAADKRVGVALPGGHIALQTDGYGISAGTQHVNEAYALAAYLTTRAEVTGPFSSSPARKSLANTLNSGPAGSLSVSGGDGGPVRALPSLSADIKALVEQGLNSGFTAADLRYEDYLDQAEAAMKSKNEDSHTALQAAEAQATKDQQTAMDAKSKTTVVVATPIPSVAAAGKSTLKFGVTSFIMPMPNKDKWDKLAQDFAASDPQVGLVDIQTGTINDLAKLADKYDCFFLPYNAVPGAKLTNLLNFDPYLAADKSFDSGDVVGNVMAQLQQDNKTWAYPMMIVPDMLSYNSDQFAKANVPAPKNGWTIEAFVDALKALKANDPKQPPFNAISPGGTHLLMLIAAYGGLPLDYRTDPPTAKFTDPATVQAIRQVLDLAKNGYIKYSALSGTGGFMMSIGSDQGPAITTQEFGGPGTRVMLNGAPDQAKNPYKVTTYPTGTQHNALSYAIETAYISAKAQNPDACYRWISTVAQHAELFSAMPARDSQINTQATLSARGADVVAAYNQVDALLKDPKTVIFPSLFQGGASPAGFLVQHWLYEAFDSYVLKNGDLDSGLKDAQAYADAFQQCTAGIAPYDPSNPDSAMTYNKAYLDCAAKVDPRLKDFVTKGAG